MRKKANDHTRTMGVGLTPCSLPQTGKPSFELEENEMEIGLGHHGEPGIEKKGELQPADQVAERLVNDILADMPLEQGEKGSRSCKRFRLHNTYGIIHYV
ncbi:hypothetical protein GCM10020331_022390 [Ectobacillus funiculus]